MNNILCSLIKNSTSFLCVKYVLAIYCFVYQANAVRDECSNMMLEVKLIVSSMESKMASIEKKLHDLNTLEYAFKVNSIDQRLEILSSNVDKLMNALVGKDNKITGTQVTSEQDENVDQAKTLANMKFEDIVSVVNQEMSKHSEKLLREQRVASQSVVQINGILSELRDMMREGFNKILVKIENLFQALTRLHGSLHSTEEHVGEIMRRCLRLDQERILVRDLLDDIRSVVHRSLSTMISLMRDFGNGIPKSVSDSLLTVIPGVRETIRLLHVVSQDLSDAEKEVEPWIEHLVHLSSIVQTHIKDSLAMQSADGQSTFNMISTTFHGSLLRYKEYMATFFLSAQDTFSDIKTQIGMMEKAVSTNGTMAFNLPALAGSADDEDLFDDI